MASGYETKCPLCGAPRAKGQMRCICNYTFEYERESRPFRRVSGSSIGMDAVSSKKWAVIVVALLVLVGGGAAIAFFAL